MTCFTQRVQNASSSDHNPSQILMASLPTRLLRERGEAFHDMMSRNVLSNSGRCGGDILSSRALRDNRSRMLGIQCACRDYVRLQQKKQLSKWAEEILEMGPAGTAKRAAALACRYSCNTADTSMAESETVEAERRLALVNAIAEMLSTAATRGHTWVSDADRRWALALVKTDDARQGHCTGKGKNPSAPAKSAGETFYC